MSELSVHCRAPSNIALVKYMGKKEGGVNLPANSSLSMTLDSLCTFVEVSRKGVADPEPIRFIPEIPRKIANSNCGVPELKSSAVDRIVRHAKNALELSCSVLASHGIKTIAPQSLEIRSANTFPAGAGIASSASSFAAITLGVCMASSQDPEQFERVFEKSVSLKRQLAQISRAGSGSSCRSFEGPWVHWSEDQSESIGTKLPALTDLVLIVNANEKEVSSSEAHRRIATSPLWKGRVERANARTAQLIQALQNSDLQTVSNLAWTEAWEMHSLFHTSAEPFTYWMPGTLEILNWVKPFLKKALPPVVTLDAGPNVHVLVPTESASYWKGLIQEKFPNLKILEDIQGFGAKTLGWARV